LPRPPCESGLPPCERKVDLISVQAPEPRCQLASSPCLYHALQARWKVASF
jgi:hypothetical protein